MPTVRAQVRLPYLSGVPEDVSVATWHFFTGLATTEPDLVEIHDRLEAAYAVSGPFISAYVDRTSCSVRMYALDDPEPRTPIYDEPLTVGTTAVQGSLPFEVALVLSFRGEYTSGTVNARRRNRSYFGPLVSNASIAPNLLPPIPTSNVIDAVTAHGHLLATPVTDSEVKWVGWSETDSVQFPIVELWCNNEWDTQRRRGIEATQRNAQPVLQ